MSHYFLNALEAPPPLFFFLSMRSVVRPAHGPPVTLSRRYLKSALMPNCCGQVRMNVLKGFIPEQKAAQNMAPQDGRRSGLWMRD
jgi:hypothetical protein